jgi:16S rRNA (guanine527-N7)-methyltransferase
MGQFFKLENELRKTLELLRINATGTVVDRLGVYVEELIRWNHQTNLTGAADEVDFVRGPLFDALTLMPLLETKGSLLDVGSGGGLPGIPAKVLFPKIRVTLVEPRVKRAKFLNHLVQFLKIDSPVIQGRDIGLTEHAWDGAVAQAVWAPAKWLKRAQRLVRPGGAIYVLSSHPIGNKDLPSGTLVEKKLHLTRPLGEAERHVYRIRK